MSPREESAILALITQQFENQRDHINNVKGDIQRQLDAQSRDFETKHFQNQKKTQEIEEKIASNTTDIQKIKNLVGYARWTFLILLGTGGFFAWLFGLGRDIIEVVKSLKQ